MGSKSRDKYMYFDKRIRSSTSRTATILKFNMSRLFRKRRKDKQQQRQILRKIDVNVNIID